MIIPGWAQIYCRHRLRGQVLMLAWLACLVPGVVFAGTGRGSVFLGLATCIHTISVLDIVLVDAGSMLERMGRGVLAFGLVGGLIYVLLPTWWGCLLRPRPSCRTPTASLPGT